MASFTSSPDTFVVEEIPAYLPAGEGPHTFLWVEKKGVTTIDAVERLARALGVSARDLGYAGMKDRAATTRQWISVPEVDPAVAGSVELSGIKVLDARRHRNKLRVGHLQGNRFEVVLQDVGPDEIVSMRERLVNLARTGLPNKYGHQRFGSAGDNLQTGLAVLRGERQERDQRRRKLLLSAVQSAVFNRVLQLRAQEGGLTLVRLGDILQKVASGGTFVCVDPACDQARVDSGEIVPTAPLPGSRVTEPPLGSPARAIEDRALTELGIGPDELGQVGRMLPGTRRPVVVAVTLGEPPVGEDPPGSARLRLRFSLPAGSYATVLLEALGVSVANAGTSNLC